LEYRLACAVHGGKNSKRRAATLRRENGGLPPEVAG